MRAPDFWRHNGLAARLLSPLGALFDAGGRLRQSLQGAHDPGVPVICVGNIVAGGSGKTPTALYLASLLRQQGRQPAFLSRGYGGRLKGPVRVDPSSHNHRDVGDEALLLARSAPTWVAKDRRLSAAAAVHEGADILIMDDGLQNNSLRKSASLLIVDGGYGFGNRQVMPAGPLRENLSRGLERVQAIILIGDAPAPLQADLRATGLPVLAARFAPPATFKSILGKRIFGFAGIGRPSKFADTLRELGAELVGFQAFPDHHVFRPSEIMAIVEAAAALDASAMTTEKDAIRLPEAADQMVQTLPIRLQFQTPEDISELLRGIFADNADPDAN